MKGFYLMFRTKEGYLMQVTKDLHTDPYLRELVEIICKEKIHNSTMINRTFTLDMVTITLGRLGWKPSDFKRFIDEYLVAEKDYAVLGVNDAKDDDEFVYTKKKLDDALEGYVGAELFVPFAERYYKDLIDIEENENET